MNQVTKSLFLRNGSIVLTVSLGGPRSRQDNFLVLTLCCVKVGEWNLVEAGRHVDPFKRGPQRSCTIGYRYFFKKRHLMIVT